MESKKPKMPVSLGRPGSSHGVETVGPEKLTGTGPLKGGGLKAEKPCEPVGQDGRVAIELEPSDIEDLGWCRTVRETGWKEGGSEAFWTLWQKHREWIWRAVRRASAGVCPKYVAKDAFEEALLERVQDGLIRRAGQYKGEAPFRAFLKRVITNAAIDQYRHYKVRRDIVLQQDGIASGDGEPDDDGATEGGPRYRTPSFPGPDHFAAVRQRRAILRLALQTVAARGGASVQMAAALRRYYLEEMSGAEIAREMGCSTDVVHQNLRRGRLAMRAVLEARFGIESAEELTA